MGLNLRFVSSLICLCCVLEILPMPVQRRQAISCTISETIPSTASDVSLEELSRLLSSKDVMARREAAKAIADWAGSIDSVVPILVTKVQDTDSEVRALVIVALGRNASRMPEKVLPALIGALADSSPAVQMEAIAVLHGMGPGAKKASPALRAVLSRSPRESTADIRTSAASAIMAIHPDNDFVIPVLLKMLKEPDARTRRLTALTLSAVSDHMARISTFVSLLGDQDPSVRLTAAYLLGRIGPKAKEAVPPLARALRDPDSEVQRSAAQALGEIGAKAKVAASSLGATLTGPDVDLKVVALQALALIGPEAKEAVPQVLLALKDADPKVRIHAAQAVGKVGAPFTAVPVVIQSLKDTEPKVRVAIVESLGTMAVNEKRILPILTKLLDHEDDDIRDATKHYLDRLRNK
jgi:HEAT repeat protein